MATLAEPKIKAVADDRRVTSLSLACVSLLQDKGLDALTPSYLASMNFTKLAGPHGNTIKKTEVWKTFGVSPMWRVKAVLRRDSGAASLGCPAIMAAAAALPLGFAV